MGGAPLEEVLVRIAHGFRPAAAEHVLEIDRLQAVVLIAVDHAGRAGDALPRAEARGDAPAGFVLHEDVEKAFKHKEHFFDLVGVRRIALPGPTYMIDRVKLPAGMTVGSPCLPDPPAPMKRCCARLKPSI